eukprot:CAMPEP_0203756578 /NCGR_PEP_ID=MMETSP0098-20131031/9834_1 /ASSEMBLY_ACC=CAM_ASM_000208 /TAXON_ID=96639 /ORGANISM=" , Strain NY0313808BC1" /LENGTH=535 /DNA_ID=CAMNT_0050648513 /DNA_START=266 /DNA_END=1873 /DNA_ORIENTATION=-
MEAKYAFNKTKNEVDQQESYPLSVITNEILTGGNFGMSYTQEEQAFGQEYSHFHHQPFTLPIYPGAASKTTGVQRTQREDLDMLLGHENAEQGQGTVQLLRQASSGMQNLVAPIWIEIPNPHTPSGDNSSLDVFLAHCKYFKDSNSHQKYVDASGILSNACYDEWILTRKKALKKPEESFRKTVTAHCTGTDGRKAFPALVEKSLLVELRKQKVWPCFEKRFHANGEKINIGLQGFRGSGHNEGSQVVNGSNSGQNARASAAPPLSFHQRKRQRDNANLWDTTNVETQIATNIESWRGNAALIRMMSKKLGVLTAEVFSLGRTDKLPLADERETELFKVLESSANPRTLRAAILVCMTRFFQPHQFMSMVTASTAFGDDSALFDERVLSLDMSIKDRRFDPNFLMPKEGFIPGVKVGQNRFCMNTFMYISSDDNSREIMEGDMTGQIPNNRIHPLAFWMVKLHIYPQLLQRRKLLWQTTSTTLLGKPIVLRTLYEIDGDVINTTFQDVSRLFPDILALESFDVVIDRFLEQSHAH